MSVPSCPSGTQGSVSTQGLSGELQYAVVLRPPIYRFRQGCFQCTRLLDIDHDSLGDLASRVAVIELGNFVAIASADLGLARQASHCLRLHWAPDDGMRDGTRGAAADSAIASRRAHALMADYGWPNRLRWGAHAGWVVADVESERAIVQVATTTPEALREDLGALLQLPSAAISLVGGRSGLGLGRLAGDDAAADAALVSQRLGQPVAVWLDADYQRDVDALGLAENWRVSAKGERGTIASLALHRGRARPAPVMALLLTDTPWQGEHDTARFVDSPYVRANPTVHGVGVGEAPRLFAEESFLDEWSRLHDSDPIDLRLRYLADERGKALVEAVRQRGQWRPLSESSGAHGLLQGRGFAYCHLPDAQGRMENGTRSAWIADVTVDPVTGGVQLTRLVVGQDAGEALDQEALASALRQELLPESMPLIRHDGGIDEWGDGGGTENASLPVAAQFAIETLSMTPTGAAFPAARRGAAATVDSQRTTTLPLRLSAQTLAPGTAAIANALFDATGQRFREPPFTAMRLRTGMRSGSDGEASYSEGPSLRLHGKERRRWQRKTWAGAAVASLLSIGGVAATVLPWKPAIDPIPRPEPDLYSQAAIARGRLVAEAGDCSVCHTESGSAGNTGGRAFETPFGTLYSTNITPDEATGIGNWSYAAFERAMRRGVSRDGRHLYPAFPYTAFAKLSDTDMQSLYAYLMAQPAVAAPAVENELRFPFNVRGLMAGWNLLNHDTRPFTPEPMRSALWNRGAYLVEGAGHCSACHSPRNALGAEKGGEDHFAGALVDGWEAPPLNALSNSPVPWTETALYDYLRTGRAEHHGVAAGPMAPVVAGLRELPESDVRAIAHYVASFMPTDADASRVDAMADERRARTIASPVGFEAGERIYQGACASCHEGGGLSVFSQAGTSLALNTNVYSQRPDNVIRAILDGVVVPDPESGDAGEMPEFRQTFSDDQLASLVGYLRARFAPGQPAWNDLAERIGEMRRESVK